MGALGYVAEKGTVGQSPETAMNMCWLVAGLYLFSAILMFVGIAVVYNLSKADVEKISADLAERHAAEKADEEVTEEQATEEPVVVETEEPVVVETEEVVTASQEESSEVVIKDVE
jgi:type II secretory pathway component PulC